MTKLLVNETSILCTGDIIVGDDRWSCDGVDYPKTTIPDGKVVDTQLPADFSLSGYIWVNNAIAPNPGTFDQITTAKSNLQNQLEDRRLVSQNIGLVYLFPDGTGTIQTRSPVVEADIANINGQTTAAMILQGQGITGAVMAFRDEQNVTHVMTPVQVITMGMAVSQFISATYQAKWTKSQQINNLATLQAASSYNIDAGWPA